MPDINGIPYVESTDLVSAYPAASQALAQEVSDQLASKPAKTSATTAPTSPATGDIWYDTNSTPPAAKFWDGSAWQVFSSGAGAAAISSPAATGQYTDGSGDTWDYFSFVTSGTLVVDTAGLLDVLCVGGGGGCTTSTGAGGGGGFRRVNSLYVDAGSLTVTVGAGGSAGSAGNESSLGTLVVAGKGGRGLSGGGSDIHAYSSGATGGGVGGFTTSGNSANGNGGFGLIYDDITGSSVGYAQGAVTGATGAEKGSGAGPRGTNASGREGIVIVRVKV